MAKISQKIQPISDYPKIGDTHEIFRQKADIAWTDLATAIPQMNQFGIQANYLANEVNDVRDETKNYRDETLNYKITACDCSVNAVNAWNNIQGYVIPSEATYSIGQIDALTEETEADIFLGFKF